MASMRRWLRSIKPLYRAGWPDQVQPPKKVGVLWAWVGPYKIGWGWDR